MAQKSLVTGGCGFVGWNLVDALVARGDDVTVVDLNETAHRPDVRYIRASITDADAMRAATSGIDSVFHNASLVHTRQNHEEVVWNVNFGGTRTVLEACRHSGVARLVYVSSASAVYEGKDIENGDEGLPYSSISQAPYADSKIAAEKLVLSANGERGVLTCAIRPHVVFGPGDNRFMPALLTKAFAGKLRYGVGRKRKLSDFTYITNLTDALLRTDRHLTPDGPAPGKAYFITNGEPMAFFDFVDLVLERLGMPKTRGRLPGRLVYLIAAVNEFLETRKGGTLTPEDGMTRFAIRYMCTHHYFSIDRARRDLGYTPQISIVDGIDRTVTWLRASGTLDAMAAAARK
jgi:sterol-4alpha-carboxylate 3-dehydrogenase (decarboxylating)